MSARGYEFYLRVFNSISHLFAVLTCQVTLEDKIHIHKQACKIFCLLHKHTNNDVFDDFPKISDHFPNINEDFSKSFRRLDERFRTFSEDCRRFSEGSGRFQRRDR